MTERIFLCKCTFCLKENINGIYLNQNTYNHHCIRIQKFSEKDNIIEKENVKDIYHLHIEKNIYLYIEDNIKKNIYIREDIQLQIEENINIYQ